MTAQAFAPGTTAFDIRAQLFLRLKPNTRLVRGPALKSIKDFIGHLTADTTLTVPIGDLIVATHANSLGWLQINADNKERGRSGTWYEVAEEVDADRSIEIDERLLTPADGEPTVQRTLRILGCNVGAAKPFVDKLSDALGPNVRVCAPRFLNVLLRRPHGAFEHLNYAFTVAMLDPAPTRDALAAAFKSSGQRFYDGASVPDALFESCIRRRLKRGFLTQKGEITSYNRHGRPSLGRRIGAERRLKTGVRLKHFTDGFTDTFTYPLGRVPPIDDPSRLADLTQLFSQSALFQSNHAFPFFQRFGFADLATFMAGFRWSFAVEGQRMTFTASRHIYRLSVPLVDRTTNRLLYNYHPRRGASVTTLPEHNPALFYTSGTGP